MYKRFFTSWSYFIGLNVKSKVIQHVVITFNISLIGILNYFNSANLSMMYKLFKSFCMLQFGSVL